MTVTVPEWLREQMAVRGMNQTQLAHRLNVSPSTVSRLLSEGTDAPSLETMRALSREFDISMSALVTMVEEGGGRGSGVGVAREHIDVVKAISEDDHLNPGDRRLLIALYHRMSQ